MPRLEEELGYELSSTPHAADDCKDSACIAHNSCTAHNARVLERHIPEAVRRWILDHHECVRASGDVRCARCGWFLRDHPQVAPTFHIICDGRLVKT